MKMKYFVAALLFFTVNCPTLQAQRGEVRVLVVYYSKDGHTRAMAEAVAEGARSIQGASVKLRSVSDAKTSDVLEADAIIVGSPVYNANVAPQVQEFINSWPFEGSPLKDKIGAAFVTAGGISAGEEIAQMNVLHSMLVFGMIVVGGPDWTGAFGASAVTAENPLVLTITFLGPPCKGATSNVVTQDPLGIRYPDDCRHRAEGIQL